jgi:hypothetical protein
MMTTGELTITISQTADGKAEYIQIASPAAMPVNIVLIASKVTIQDRRAPDPDHVSRLPRAVSDR